MAISLPALLKLANLPQDRINKLIKNIDYVSDEDKLKLSNYAWSSISDNYFTQLALVRIKILDEVKQGKRQYNPNDIEEVKAGLMHELTQKLQATETDASIEEVRQELEKFKPKKAKKNQDTSKTKK